MKLPQKNRDPRSDVAGPGLPGVQRRGRTRRHRPDSFGQNFLIFSRNQRAIPSCWVNVEESSAVLLHSEVLPLSRGGSAVGHGRPIAWFGAYGLQPMDPEVPSCSSSRTSPAWS